MCKTPGEQVMKHDKKEAYRIEITNNPEVLEEISKLRVIAWRASGELAERAYPDGKWLDSHDDPSHAIHWTVFDNKDRLIASARLCVHCNLDGIPDFEDFPTGRSIRGETDLPVGCLNRLVVHPSAQLKGLAKRLDEIRVEKAKELGVKTLIVQGGERRIKSLLKQGFIILAQSEFDPLFSSKMLFLMLRICEKAKTARIESNKVS